MSRSSCVSCVHSTRAKVRGSGTDRVCRQHRERLRIDSSSLLDQKVGSSEPRRIPTELGNGRVGDHSFPIGATHFLMTCLRGSSSISGGWRYFPTGTLRSRSSKKFSRNSAGCFVGCIKKGPRPALCLLTQTARQTWRVQTIGWLRQASGGQSGLVPFIDFIDPTVSDAPTRFEVRVLKVGPGSVWANLWVVVSIPKRDHYQPKICSVSSGS